MLKQYLRQGFIFKPILFIFLVILTPSIDSSMFAYQDRELNFSFQFYSYISIAVSLTNIFAVMFYRQFLQNIGLSKIITVTTLSMCLFKCLKLMIIFKLNTKIGISNEVFYMISECTYSFVNEIHLMPLMVMACRICPKKVEATVYEFILSIINLGYLISYQSGGWVSNWLNITNDNFDNLWILIVISAGFP